MGVSWEESLALGGVSFWLVLALVRFQFPVEDDKETGVCLTPE